MSSGSFAALKVDLCYERVDATWLSLTLRCWMIWDPRSFG
jgi:hypothetical protein